MAGETVLRYSLVFLGALVLGIGIYTMSFKKMIATYVFGLLAISGVLLPDWEFFDRDFSKWLTPMPARDRSAPASQPLRFFIGTSNCSDWQVVTAGALGPEQCLSSRIVFAGYKSTKRLLMNEFYNTESERELRLAIRRRLMIKTEQSIFESDKNRCHDLRQRSERDQITGDKGE
ncbi:hypothetical protein ACLOJK_016265 [Asimina triloba]